MFIQVIEGKTNDADGLRQQLERWAAELGPNATGYLGSTGGVGPDGTAIFMARFDSEEAAQANSERPEQGEWWNETARFFEGDVTFRNCRDVETMFGGGSDDAGFVQVMQGRVRDRERLRELEGELERRLREMRPEVTGIVRAWDGDHFTQAVYFTDEAKAREGEASTPDEQPQELREYMSLVEDVTYVDLKEPWLHSS